MFDFQKVLSATKIPNVDVKSQDYIDAQKKTLEALASASQAVFVGVNAFANKQVEILNTAIVGVKDASTDVANGNTKESAAKSIDLVKTSDVRTNAHRSQIPITIEISFFKSATTK